MVERGSESSAGKYWHSPERLEGIAKLRIIARLQPLHDSPELAAEFFDLGALGIGAQDEFEPMLQASDVFY